MTDAPDIAPRMPAHRIPTEPAPGAMDDATRAQVGAADPARSAWVSANAGSGKTRVLTDRVARLLLADAPPEKILCLTYTKAAAAEMQTRLFALLGRWAMMDDDALLAELQSRSETPLALEDGALDRARRLFASALETPGGLKIQTIHAFCDALLRRFPLEAGVSPRFDVLDDRQRAAMLTALRDRMAEDAARGVDLAFDGAADRVGEGKMAELTDQILDRRDLFGADDAALAAGFGLDPFASVDQLLDEAAAMLDDGAMAELAAGFARAGKRAKDKIPGIARTLDALAACRGAEAVEIARATLLKASGDPYAPDWLLGKTLAAQDEALCDLYFEVASGVSAAVDARQTVDGFAKACDLNRFARSLIAAYEAEKASLSALDFSDLVGRAGALLTTADMAAWVLFKLDGGVDHILIDEAQDTAPAQWAVIRALAEEFFAGEGARAAGRTLFVVGDEKQSIYSFQGADPAEFGKMRGRFAARLAAGPVPLHIGELAHSFRSAPAILTLTDQVFAPDAEGLTAAGAPPRHVAHRKTAPGLVEMWPFFGKLDAAPEPDWQTPVDAPAPTAPKTRLARAVAEHVAAMLHEGAPIPTRGGGWRAMRPRDVLILVQSRKGLAPGIIRGLKSRGIDVSGADRLILTQDLAVRDLLALLRVALDPGDDLSLAALLRSPLGQLSETGLYELAHGRGGRLRDVLADRPHVAPRAHALVEDAIRAADFQRPHELLSRALVEHGGRAALLARLGPEAEDPIDELLSQALAYERAETPTLAGFLSWIDAADTLAIKREQGGGADEVRVMTVHGAKGLEAPFVVLPDTGPRGAGTKGRDVLTLDGPDGPLAGWSVPKKDGRPSVIAAAVEALELRETHERRRLLYVALTRAEDRLLIAGAGDEGKVEGSWYGMIRAGLVALGATSAEAPPALRDEPAGEALRHGPLWPAAPRLADPGPELAAVLGPEAARDPAAEAAPAAGPEAAAETALEAARNPDPARRAADLRRPAPPPAAARRLSPSGLGAGGGAGGAQEHDAAQWASEGGIEGTGEGEGHAQALALARGDLVHLLVERLADLPDRARPAAAAALIARHGGAVPAPLQSACAAEACAALALPQMAPFLGGASLAEAGLSVDLPALGGRLSGRIDRIALLDDRIAVIDYKTGRFPSLGDPAPEGYVRQLAAYRAALAALHPGVRVEAHLLWTGAPRLDRLPDGALDDAWTRMTAPGKT